MDNQPPDPSPRLPRDFVVASNLHRATHKGSGPEDEIESQIRGAYIARDDDRLRDLLRSHDPSTAFLFDFLGFICHQSDIPKGIPELIVEDKGLQAQSLGTLKNVQQFYWRNLAFACIKPHTFDEHYAAYFLRCAANAGYNIRDCFEEIVLRLDKMQTESFVDMLLETALPEEKQGMLDAFFVAAVVKDDLGFLQKLIDKGANVNAEDGAALRYFVEGYHNCGFDNSKKESDAFLEKIFSSGFCMWETLDECFIRAMAPELMLPAPLLVRMLAHGADPYRAKKALDARCENDPIWSEHLASLAQYFFNTIEKRAQEALETYPPLTDQGTYAHFFIEQDDNGDTGLMIAIRARKLTADLLCHTVHFAKTNGTDFLMLRNRRDQSPLTLAADRHLLTSFLANFDSGILPTDDKIEAHLKGRADQFDPTAINSERLRKSLTARAKTQKFRINKGS